MQQGAAIKLKTRNEMGHRNKMLMRAATVVQVLHVLLPPPKEVMFSLRSVCLFFCLSVCLAVR